MKVSQNTRHVNYLLTYLLTASLRTFILFAEFAGKEVLLCGVKISRVVFITDSCNAPMFFLRGLHGLGGPSFRPKQTSVLSVKGDLQITKRWLICIITLNIMSLWSASCTIACRHFHLFATSGSGRGSKGNGRADSSSSDKGSGHGGGSSSGSGTILFIINITLINLPSYLYL